MQDSVFIHKEWAESNKQLIQSYKTLSDTSRVALWSILTRRKSDFTSREGLFS